MYQISEFSLRLFVGTEKQKLLSLIDEKLFYECTLCQTGNVFHFHAVKAYMGMEVQFHSFLKSALDGRVW